MRVLLCDDDPLWVTQINKLLQKSSHIQELSITTSSQVDEILDIIDKQDFDLAYLDIMIHDITGLDIAKKLTDNNPLCLIIFVTNYGQYVSEAFSLQVFQYLYKPIDTTLFYKELDRAILKYNKYKRIYPLNTTEGKKPFQPIYVMYIETYYKSIKIVTTHNKYYSNIKNLKYIKEILTNFNFIQTHQSFYVNMHYIARVNSHDVSLFNQEKIPLSLSKRIKVRKTFYNFLVKQDKNI